MNWSSRFKSQLDECTHLVLGLILSDVLDAQKNELIDNYGIDITEKAIQIVNNDYKSLLLRF